MNYYKKKLYIPQIDRNDNIIGPIERWQAHKDSILHRGFTVILNYQDKIIVQHRKHPVFEGYFDISCSSHQIYMNNQLQSIEDAIGDVLVREWHLYQDDLIGKPVFLDKSYYQAKDSQSDYYEHEICHFYLQKINKLPQPDDLYCYDFLVIDKNKLKDKSTNMNKMYPPWVPHVIGLL